jgi:hypothetical protein
LVGFLYGRWDGPPTQFWPQSYTNSRERPNLSLSFLFFLGFSASLLVATHLFVVCCPRRFPRFRARWWWLCNSLENSHVCVYGSLMSCGLEKFSRKFSPTVGLLLSDCGTFAQNFLENFL